MENSTQTRAKELQSAMVTPRNVRARQIAELHSQAKSKMNLDCYDDAAEIFKSILVLDPNNIKALVRLGDLCAQNSNHQAAFHYYWRAYDLSREKNTQHVADPHLTKRVARLHSLRGEFELARQKLEEVIQVSSRDADARQILDQMKDPWFEGVMRTLSFKTGAVLSISPALEG